MHDSGKRSFFRNFFKETIIKPIAAFQSGMQEVDTDKSLDEFFESYESSYALTLNYPDDILIETARMEGIAVEGREKIDIVSELIKRKAVISIKVSSIIRERLDSLLITASWFPDLKNVIGLQGVSPVWQDNPAYYLWLKGVPCVFQLECDEAHYESGHDEKLICSVFSVRAFPFRNTDLYQGFSAIEREILNSPVFDGSNTPSFDHLQDLDKNLFLVSRIEWICPESASWNMFSMNALDLSIIRRGAIPTDPPNLSFEPFSDVLRRVPSWEISLPLFDVLNTLHVFYSRQKLRNLRVVSRNGLEYVISPDGKAELDENGAIKDLEVETLFMDERLFKKEGHKNLPGKRLETDPGEIILDRIFEWTDRLDGGFILEGSKNEIGRKWWTIGETHFDAPVSSLCGCSHD